MTKPQQLFYRFLLTVGLFFVALFGFWWFNPQHIAQTFTGWFHIIDLILFGLLSYVVWYQIVNEIFSWIVSSHMKRPVHMKPQPGLKVAFLTAFVPGVEPYDVLERALKAMIAVEYPHDTWLLDEGDDEKAKELCRKYGVKHYTRKGSRRYNLVGGPYKKKTKGGNYNSWFSRYAENYQFVAQVDVDFAPNKNFLTKTLGYFKDADVAFVGSPQVYGNTSDSWITKGAAEQAYNFYGSMQKGFFGKDMQLFIGANHVVRVAAHNSIEGYAGHIVEDHLTGMKLYAGKWKSVYVPEILALGEGPSTWSAYFSQQMRWAYGLIDILFTQSPSLFQKMKWTHRLYYFLLQQYYFFGIAQVIGIVLLSLYFLFGIQSTQMTLIPLLLFYVPVLLWQQVMFLWLQRFNIDPKTESGLMVRSKLLNYAAWPVYFLAFIGVIRRKRMTYKVTPKGSMQETDISLQLFIPHVVLGSITALDIIAAFYLQHEAIQLLFWAVINTIIMWYFVMAVGWEKIRNKINGMRYSIPRITPSSLEISA